jgi:anaerobic magnesium-protoporphyrin IX monomethyl ester cyclase
MPALGLCWLAAVCRSKGYRTTIIDAAVNNRDHKTIAGWIAGLHADYVGITALTCSIHSASLLAQAIKKNNMEIRTLIGGPHVTTLPEDTMRMFPAFDTGFIGEGEETILDYLKAMETGDKLEDVKGLVYKSGNSIRVTEPRPFIENLDSLPLPAWDLLDGFPRAYAPAAIRCRHLPASHVVTSRGCPMKCTFCDRSVFGNRYRFFSVEYTFEMIKSLVNTFKVRDILFEDDSFTLHKNRVIALCELIGKNNLHFSWSCLGRVDSIDAELLRFMKRAGCWQIGFGIESANPGVLDEVEKKTNLENIRKALAMTRAAGIRTKGFFILGLPHETKASMRTSMKFAREVDLDDISVSFCTPFPGTVLFEKADEYGEFTRDLEKMNLMHAVFVPSGLTRKQLEERHAEFFRRFYLRPRVFLDYFARVLADPRVLIRITKGALFFLVGSFLKKQ